MKLREFCEFVRIEWNWVPNTIHSALPYGLSYEHLKKGSCEVLKTLVISPSGYNLHSYSGKKGDWEQGIMQSAYHFYRPDS